MENNNYQNPGQYRPNNNQGGNQGNWNNPNRNQNWNQINQNNQNREGNERSRNLSTRNPPRRSPIGERGNYNVVVTLTNGKSEYPHVSAIVHSTTYIGYLLGMDVVAVAVASPPYTTRHTSRRGRERRTDQRGNFGCLSPSLSNHCPREV